jgi:hypothetical protein
MISKGTNMDRQEFLATDTEFLLGLTDDQRATVAGVFRDAIRLGARDAPSVLRVALRETQATLRREMNLYRGFGKSAQRALATKTLITERIGSDREGALAYAAEALERYRRQRTRERG